MTILVYEAKQLIFNILCQKTKEGEQWKNI